MKRLTFLLLILLAAPALARRDAGITIEVRPESTEVQAGDDLTVAAVVRNTANRGQFVIVEGYLAPPEEPVLVPPVPRWERFVWELLAKASGDTEILFVPAGESRTALLTVEVHPRMHGRFEVVGRATALYGGATDRASIVSRITAPPSNGGVLVHGMVYELGPCRVLLTDDGHVYEPRGPLAEEMFHILSLLRPHPDGVTVLGSILPNTTGCIGVELGVGLYRFDREPGTPVGIRWRHLSRGRSPRPYSGPREEVVRTGARLWEILDALGAELSGAPPNFRREMVAVVTVPGTRHTGIRVTRAVEKDGILTIHYLVTRAGPGADLPSIFAQPYHIVALPRFGGPVRFERHDLTVPGAAARTGVLEVAESLDLLEAATIDRRSPLGRTLDRSRKERGGRTGVR